MQGAECVVAKFRGRFIFTFLPDGALNVHKVNWSHYQTRLGLENLMFGNSALYPSDKSAYTTPKY